MPTTLRQHSPIFMRAQQAPTALPAPATDPRTSAQNRPCTTDLQCLVLRRKDPANDASSAPDHRHRCVPYCACSQHPFRSASHSRHNPHASTVAPDAHRSAHPFRAASPTPADTSDCRSLPATSPPNPLEHHQYPAPATSPETYSQPSPTGKYCRGIQIGFFSFCIQPFISLQALDTTGFAAFYLTSS